MPRLYIADSFERADNWKAAVDAWEGLYGSCAGSSVAVDPATRLRYALALKMSGRPVDARLQYEQAMEEIQQTYAHVLPDEEFRSAGMPDSRLAPAIYVAIASCLPLYGWTYPRLEQKDRRKQLETAVRLDPKWAFARLAYVRELVREHDNQEALKQYAEAARLASGSMRIAILREEHAPLAPHRIGPTF